MGAPLIAIKMGLEESLPSYCFSSSVVNGSSFGGAMSFRGACMMLSSGFFESVSAGGDECNLDRMVGNRRCRFPVSDRMDVSVDRKSVV